MVYIVVAFSELNLDFNFIDQMQKESKTFHPL